MKIIIPISGVNQTNMDKQLNELTAENRMVKSNCKKQFNGKKYWNEQCDKISKLAIDYITEEENMWIFCSAIDYTLIGKCYTYIRPYTNKKGITTDAHHTYYGKWVGSVKSKGDKPVLVNCWMPVNKLTFTFDNTKQGEYRFIPIEYNGKRFYEDDDIEETIEEVIVPETVKEIIEDVEEEKKERTKKDIKADKIKFREIVNRGIAKAKIEKRELTQQEIKRINSARKLYESFKKELKDFTN